MTKYSPLKENEEWIDYDNNDYPFVDIQILIKMHNLKSIIGEEISKFFSLLSQVDLKKENSSIFVEDQNASSKFTL